MLKRFAFIKSYKWRHFFAHYGIMVFLFLSIPFFTVYTSLWYYNINVANERIVDTGNKLIIDASKKTEDTFAYLDSIYSSLCNDENTIKYLMKENLSDEVAAEYVSQITKDFKNYRLSNPIIDGIYLLKLSNNYVVVSDKNSITNNYVDKFADKECFEINPDSTSFLITRNVTVSNSSKKYITCYYPVYTGYFGDLMFGILAINIQADSLLASISQVLPEDAQLCVMYSGKPIASTHKNNQELVNAFNNSKNEKIIQIIKNTDVISGETIKTRDISTFFSYESNEYENNWFLNRNTLIIMFIIILIISILSAYIITDNFYKVVAETIIETTDVMQLYNQDKKYSKRFDKLSQRILFTFERRKIIERSLYERMNYLRDSQFAALQTQITPHFLFNTLNILNLLELKIIKKRSEIGQVVAALSDILRYSMDTQNYLVSFKDELNYTLKYLDIQSLRYGDDLDIIYDISDDTMDFTVLKFILQPILENAIHYAIANNKKGVVKIKTSIVSDMLCIDISDNGNAFAADKLLTIQNMLDKGLIDSDHTSGLLNTNKRLKMIFGQEYNCEASTNSGKTIISLKIPKI